MSKIFNTLPPPFEWVAIPNAVVELGETPYSRENTVEKKINHFYISKYPITVAQYRVYVSETGKVPILSIPFEQVFHENSITIDDHPISHLRWIEAMSFCSWLTLKLGYLVTLPTDAQWLFAAQGNDNRKYPWGNVWDSDLCNSKASGIGHLTSVLHYPEGASLFGVIDMLGNATEWCLTDGLTGEDDLNYDFSDEEQSSTYRVIMGSHYASSRISTNLYVGSCPLFLSYVTGIRLVTSHDVQNLNEV